MQGYDIVVLTALAFILIIGTVIWLVVRIRQSSAMREKLKEEYRRALRREARGAYEPPDAPDRNAKRRDSPR